MSRFARYEPFYVVEEGAVNPRDESIGWRPWSVHDNYDDAMKAAHVLHLARVLEARQIWVSRGVKKFSTVKG